MNIRKFLSGGIVVAALLAVSPAVADEQAENIMMAFAMANAIHSICPELKVNVALVTVVQQLIKADAKLADPRYAQNRDLAAKVTIGQEFDGSPTSCVAAWVKWGPGGSGGAPLLQK